ncbi:MAG: MarR family transcriptional regulator [Xanthobacteraceae bacterium]|nr:MAG: MarR family transcriptional regulator [Xanthobacteraceae bacterium]
MDCQTADKSPISGQKLELDTFLPYRLNVLANVVSQGLSSIYAERYRLGIPEWRVIATLGQFGSMTAKQVGAHSHMHKTKVSRAVASLTSRKIVHRRANRRDLREAFISLTRDGEAIYADLVPIAQSFAAELSEGFTPDERLQLDRLLTRLTEKGWKLLNSSGVTTSDGD